MRGISLTELKVRARKRQAIWPASILTIPDHRSRSYIYNLRQQVLRASALDHFSISSPRRFIISVFQHLSVSPP